MRPPPPEAKLALGLAEFVHYGLLGAIVICSRQSVVEVDLARALRELALSVVARRQALRDSRNRAVRQSLALDPSAD